MNSFYTVANALLSGVQSELTTSPSGWPDTARTCVVPGELAWDDCECGLLAVEMLPLSFSQAFPTEANIVDDSCAMPYVTVIYAVTILRCAPAVNNLGTAPTCEALSAAAEILMDDVVALLSGVSSALETLLDTDTITAFAIRNITPLGPQGGCVGVQQQVVAGFRNVWGPCVG